jgi:hypothetical protein
MSSFLGHATNIRYDISSQPRGAATRKRDASETHFGSRKALCVSEMRPLLYDMATHHLYLSRFNVVADKLKITFKMYAYK